MPQRAIKQGCVDIASQLIDYQSNINARYKGANSNGIEVVMGGGIRHFLPEMPADTESQASPGQRPDGRNNCRVKALYPSGLFMDSEKLLTVLTFRKSTKHLGYLIRPI